MCMRSPFPDLWWTRQTQHPHPPCTESTSTTHLASKITREWQDQAIHTCYYLAKTTLATLWSREQMNLGNSNDDNESFEGWVSPLSHFRLWVEDHLLFAASTPSPQPQLLVHLPCYWPLRIWPQVCLCGVQQSICDDMEGRLGENHYSCQQRHMDRWRTRQTTMVHLTLSKLSIVFPTVNWISRTCCSPHCMSIASAISCSDDPPVECVFVVVNGIEHRVCNDMEGRLGANHIEGAVSCPNGRHILFLCLQCFCPPSG